MNPFPSSENSRTPCNNPVALPSLVVSARSGGSNLRSALLEEPAIAIPEELERAYRAHHGLVFRTAYRITGNAADAEDVLQTVFLRLLHRSPGSMQSEESYLRRAAINAALDILRSRQSDRTVELIDLPGGRSPNETADLRRSLAQAMSKLDARSAEVFTLRFLEGFTNPQIAGMLGISQVLVAVIVHRTRRQLRKELGAHLGDRS
jgi:RNA polymerase sigma-70 factor, ECF subfamily